MENNKKIESLSHDVEFLDQLISSMIEEFKTLEASLKQIEGFSFGCKETSDKFENYILKHKAEILNLEKEGKIHQAVGSLLNVAANNSLNFIKERAKEADKLYYIRQGEILSLKNRVIKLKSLQDSTKVEIEKLKVEEEKSVEATVAIPNQNKNDLQQKEKIEEQTEESKIRPDKNLNTKIGRAATDLMQRRKKSTENSNIQETKSKRGRKKKI